MLIVGISCYSHESSCAVVRDGEIVATIEEERLNRQKNTSRFPTLALQECLRIAGAAPADVDEFAFSFLPWRMLSGNAAHFLRHLPASLNLLAPGTSAENELPYLRQFQLMLRLNREIERTLALRRAPRVRYIEHHLAHAASAFLPSPFEEAAILSMDGRGEDVTTMLARGSGNRIEVLGRRHVPHSLGHLYSAVTAHLGFRAFHDEWKVMGLSAYGSAALVRRFADLVRLEEDGTFSLDLRYFRFYTHGQKAWVSRRFIEEFGLPRAPGTSLEDRHCDLAFALQRVLEDVAVHIARALGRRTGSRKLCLAGGVALNCLMNQALLERTEFDDLFVQPMAGDAGTALGAALSRHYDLASGDATRAPFANAYLGPAFSDTRTESALTGAGLRYHRSEHVCREAAELLAAGKIIGWFQGRMEAGPRALGNRSILADPTLAGIKDRLNVVIKRRESFRPFAPSVLDDDADAYFELPKGVRSPFMNVMARVRADQRAALPAVTHVDGSARVHTVTYDSNPRYWELISCFRRLRGVPVVLNTSFNEQEPIVCTPEEAIDCYLRSKLDALVLGDFVVIRDD